MNKICLLILKNEKYEFSQIIANKNLTLIEKFKAKSSQKYFVAKYDRLSFIHLDKYETSFWNNNNQRYTRKTSLA